MAKPKRLHTDRELKVRVNDQILKYLRIYGAGGLNGHTEQEVGELVLRAGIKHLISVGEMAKLDDPEPPTDSEDD